MKIDRKLIIMAVLMLGFIFAMIFYIVMDKTPVDRKPAIEEGSTNKTETSSETPKKPIKGSGGKEEADIPMDHVHGETEDGLLDDTETGTHGSLTFKRDEVFKGAIVEKGYPSLIGQNEENLLLLTATKILYFYNMETQEVQAIDEHVKQAILTSDNEAIYYTKEMNGSDVIYEYDLVVNLNKGPIASVLIGGDVLRMAYANGAFVYTYPLLDPHTPYVMSEAIISKRHTVNYHLGNKEAKSVKTSQAFTTVGKNFFFYSPEYKAIRKWDITNKATDWAAVDKAVNHPAHLAINAKGGWALLDREEIGLESTILTADGPLKEFEMVFSMEWLFNQYLVVSDNHHLYLFDPKTEEKVLLKSDVSFFFIDNDVIYTQVSSTSEIFPIHVKRQG